MMNSGSASLPLVRLSATTLVGTRWSYDWRGKIVVDQAGYEIGRVADLVIDEESYRVYFMIVQPSGFIFGEGEPIVPVDAIGRRIGDHLSVDHDHEHVAAGPRYDPELISDSGYQAGVYAWYGFAPYWHSSYVRSHGGPRRKPWAASHDPRHRRPGGV